MPFCVITGGSYSELCQCERSVITLYLPCLKTVSGMSDSLNLSAQNSEDLLADFESLVNCGAFDLGGHPVVIISTPGHIEVPTVAPPVNANILFVATPQTSSSQERQVRTHLDRPPVGDLHFQVQVQRVNLLGYFVAVQGMLGDLFPL